MERNRTEHSIIFRLLTKSFDLGLRIPKSKLLGLRERYCMASVQRIRKKRDGIFRSTQEFMAIGRSICWADVKYAFLDRRKIKINYLKELVFRKLLGGNASQMACPHVYCDRANSGRSASQWKRTVPKSTCTTLLYKVVIWLHLH